MILNTRRALADAEHVAVLTGAGLSAASGLATFRGGAHVVEINPEPTLLSRHAMFLQKDAAEGLALLLT